MNGENKKYRRSGLVWPIVLILVGVVFLLKNLGFIDSLAWDSIWKLWPLIFVAVGLDGLIRRREVAGPVIMFALAGAFLLSNYGWGWRAWDSIWRLWPLLVIAVGLEIMVGRRSIWLSALSVLAVLVVLGGLLWLGGITFERFSGQSVTSEIINQELGAASKADINISMAAGEMNLQVLDDLDALVAGDVSTGSGQEVRSEYKLQGSTAYYFLRSRNPVPFPRGDWDWKLGLAPEIPMELDASMGAGEMDLDLQEIALTSLDASQGVGDMTVILPAGVSMKGDISQAIGDMVILVPGDVAVCFEVSKAISNLDVPNDFERQGDNYCSPDYEDADERIDLDVSQAIGNIEIRYGK